MAAMPNPARAFIGASLASHRRLHGAGEEPRAAIARGADPKPVQGHGQAVTQADQEIDVGDAPGPPGEPAAQLDPPEIDDGGALADGGEATVVPVAEGPRRAVAGEALPD